MKPKELFKIIIMCGGQGRRLGAQCGRFLYMSTSECYGLQTQVPFEEDMLPFPISPYAIGKMDCLTHHQSTTSPSVC